GFCAWALPGVGAVATQSFTERGYGPRGLELLAAGESPGDALAQLVEADERRDFRQVAFLAADGRTAAHTGAACIPECGHTARDGLSAQGNMLASPEVWSAAADTFAATESDLAERLRAAGLPEDQVAFTAALVAVTHGDLDEAAARLRPTGAADPRWHDALERYVRLGVVPQGVLDRLG